ncbi:hypothetical protein HDV62DRAFT_177268 [Trichoderma sp. SZMC 28011]
MTSRVWDGIHVCAIQSHDVHTCTPSSGSCDERECHLLLSGGGAKAPVCMYKGGTSFFFWAPTASSKNIQPFSSRDACQLGTSHDGRFAGLKRSPARRLHTNTPRSARTPSRFCS